MAGMISVISVVDCCKLLHIECPYHTNSRIRCVDSGQALTGLLSQRLKDTGFSGSRRGIR
jgi:hypothetical protein